MKLVATVIYIHCVEFMKPINDLYHRQRALDPHHSFIVQAPAGSGKTELLTQRFLTLLSSVNFPEEILAITFTKKSSAEMRDRIITALTEATQDKPVDSTHKQLTRELALKALKQNQIQQWNLIENPNRLRIQTIDSFNAWLARQLPTLSRFGSSPDIADDPILLYREAIQEFLLHLEENTDWSNAIEQLLLHRDNDLNKVEELLIQMLQKRDQWLPYITLDANDPRLRQALENNLATIVTDSLLALHTLFPKEERDEIVSLANIAADNLTEESPIFCCKNLNIFPSPNLQHRAIWLGLSKLLLTEKLEWRKRFDKNMGFPPKSPKERIEKLIEKLYHQEALRQAFIELNYAPKEHYSEEQWAILSALYQVLKIVVAQLKLVFQQHGKIDYIENSEAALAALGSEDRPTDLALALDYKIQHILIDEFQDTSNNQFRLLEKLTAGWENGDGRTLFLVGDPMQSIYRFREAEVGLFIRARDHGIHHIHLEPLTLSVNFRSVPGIIGWVNIHFNRVLPSYDDIASGAISFSPSTAIKDPGTTPEVKLHCLNDQTSAMIEIIQSKKENESIALLVRSRTHLKQIIPALRKHNIPYRAIDIDPLTTRPLIQDLLALTKALLHPANRIAWLSILHAPWCGLRLNDLLVLSQHGKHETIVDRLYCFSTITELSDDAKHRLSRIFPILEQQMANKRRMSLRKWIESTWHSLGGPACLDDLSDLDDAITFFNLLEKLDKGADLTKLNYLDEAIEKLYAAPKGNVDTALQIMTLHNAKGLEFDTVILPHLESRAPYDSKQLLLWMERPNADADSHLIIAPVHAIGDEQDFIYEYIKRQHRIKSDFEIGRLLYVAATRAKNKLHLLFSLESSPPSNSLLEKLWPAIKNNVSLPPVFDNPNHDTVTLPIKKLKRLTTEWENPVSMSLNTVSLHQKIPGFKLDNEHPKQIGILIHKILEYIARRGRAWWESKEHSSHVGYVKKQLLQLGMLEEFIHSSSTIIIDAIQNTLNDPRGQWILHSHLDAKTEFSVTTIIDQQPKELIIDRTFIDETGTRWIIDYKSSSPDAVALEEFLLDEHKKYEPQMQNYYLALRELDNNSPIRLGLYFPLMSAWYEWG